MINFKMQLLCLCLLLYLGIYHSRQKRLYTRKVHLFHQIFAVSILNLVFDIMMIYLSIQVEQVSYLVDRYTNQLFFGSLMLVLYLFNRYIVSTIEHKQKCSCVIRALQLLPMVMVLISLLLGPFYYYLERNGIYANGLITVQGFVGSGLYLIMNLYFLLRYYRNIELEVRDVLLPSLILIIIVFGVQIIFPQANVTGMVVVFIVIGVFFSLKSQEYYLDKKSMAFTTEGFHVALKEVWNTNKNFKIVSIYIKNINEIRAEYGLAAECILLKEVQRVLRKKYRLDLFITYDGCISLIIKKDKEGTLELKSIPKYLEQGFNIKDSAIYLNYEIQTVHSTEYQNAEEALEKILKTANEIQYVRAYTDVPTGLGNHNAYEKDMNHIYNLRKEYKSIWYLVMNINNLKQVNHQYGRIHGDELLRDCAKILRKIISENHRVYRVVGDELCVIVLNESEKQIESMLAQFELERQKMNQERSIPISFALGYSGYNPDSDFDLSEAKVRADKMMYQNKGYYKANIG